MKDEMPTLFPFFCESPQRACVHLQELFAIYLPLWYTALITYVNVILNLNLYRGEFNAARCLQVQVREGDLLQKEFVYCRAGRRSNTRHHPPQGRSRYASFVQIRWSLFLVNCQKKNRGRCCVCRKEVCGLLGFFFYP